MEKTKITIELENDVVEQIKDLFKKYNENPIFSTKFSSIEDYLAHVITSQIRNADKMSEKLEQKLKELTEKLQSLDLGGMDFSKIFEEMNKKKEDPKKDDIPDKNVKN